MAVNGCDGLCEDCATPEFCNDNNICKQHSGNAANIASLKERVGDLEERDSIVYNLTGRVNLLINISLIVIAAIIGNFAHSITMNKKFEEKYVVDSLELQDTLANDRLVLKDSLHNMQIVFMSKIDQLTKDIRTEMQQNSRSMGIKIDTLSNENDSRFDVIERKLPMMDNDLKNFKDAHNIEMKSLRDRSSGK